jgi:hypothetical protein
MKPFDSIRRPVWLGAAVAATILGSSVVPYANPPTERTIGASFELGFNNSLAFALYAALVTVAGGLCGLIFSKLRIVESGRWRPVSRNSRILLAVVLLAHVFVFVGIYLSRGRFLFADAIYLQTLLYRLRIGELPYLDFGYYYGPSMLYPVHWLASVLGPDAGYGVAFIGTYVAGIVILFAILHRIVPSAAVANLWFVILSVGLFSPLATLNVTFLRFLLPVLVYFLVYDATRGRARPPLVIAGLVLGFALAYSFDVALLSTGAALIGSAAAVFERRFESAYPSASAGLGSAPAQTTLATALRGATVLAIGLILAIGSLVAIDLGGRAVAAYPRTALAYVSGAHNAPVYPSLPFLLLIAATVLSVGVAFNAVWIHRGGRAWVIVGLCAVALATERGAFGSFEVAHISSFGLPVFILALGGLEAVRLPRTRTVMVAAIALAWVAPLQYYHATQLAPGLVASPRARPIATSAAPASTDRATIESAIAGLVEMIGTDRPYFMPGLEYYSLPVYRDRGLRYPTYESHMVTAETPAGIARVINEVRAAGAIVLVPSSDLVALAGPSLDRSNMIELLAGAMTPGWPLTPIVAENRARLYGPFFEFLRREYVQLYERSGIVALGPRAERRVTWR